MKSKEVVCHTDIGPVKFKVEPKPKRQTFGDKVVKLVSDLLDKNYVDYEGSCLQDDDFAQIKEMVDKEHGKLKKQSSTFKKATSE